MALNGCRESRRLAKTTLAGEKWTKPQRKLYSGYNRISIRFRSGSTTLSMTCFGVGKGAILTAVIPAEEVAQFLGFDR